MPCLSNVSEHLISFKWLSVMQREQCLLVPCCPTCPPCYLCYRSKCVPASLNQRQPCSSADTWQYLEMFLKVMGGGRSGCWHLAGILTWLHCINSAPLTEVRTLKPTMPRLESPELQLNEQIPVCTPASPFLLLNTDGRTVSLLLPIWMPPSKPYWSHV